jgi:hypothetical protein
VSRKELLAEMAMQCHWPGRSRADVAASLGDGRRETWLESYAFVRLAEWDVVLPEPQVKVFDEVDHFVARTDGAWVEDATVLELDGKPSTTCREREWSTPRRCGRRRRTGTTASATSASNGCGSG